MVTPYCWSATKANRVPMFATTVFSYYRWHHGEILGNWSRPYILSCTMSSMFMIETEDCTSGFNKSRSWSWVVHEHVCWCHECCLAQSTSWDFQTWQPKPLLYLCSNHISESLLSTVFLTRIKLNTRWASE